MVPTSFPARVLLLRRPLPNNVIRFVPMMRFDSKKW